MSIMVESSKEQAWRNMIPQAMSFSEEDCSEYSFADIYTGPRPAYVPKAEPFCNSSVSSRVVVNSHPNCSSPSPSQVVVDLQSSMVWKSHESFVNEARDEFPSRESTWAASVVTEQFPSPSQHEASLENGDAAQANLHALHDMFTSSQLESGEVPPYVSQEDHISTHSEFSGRQSSSCHSSTNSLSHELQDQTSPEPSPSNTHQRKKGQCFLCAKVNRMQEKETCLVCSAKYCGSCVLKVMGSMPEGRKCVQCIGKPICEFRRHDLGKPTRLLIRLLSTLEVQQIMKSERCCSANQLRPDQLYVNGRQLTAKEFAELLGCSNPPSRLKPGRYWYDSQCGYWGKEGEKPEKIITVHLKVGGDLPENASAGCTKVYINNREITKVELKMLKFAGVLCPPQTRLWLYQDGSYQEEVQNHIPGKIWEKATARCLCYLVALPTPNFRAAAPEPLSRSVPAYLESKTTQKILLLGHPGCGTSTIIKQAKFLYEEQFTPKELQDIKAKIQRDIYKYIVILLEARERFEEEENAKRRELEENTPSTSAQIESGDSGQEPRSLQRNSFTMTARLKDQADWFLQTDASGDLEKYYPAVNREHASLIEELWKDPAIQATYKRRAELHMLPDVAGDFLSRVVDISAINYTPTDRDILCAEGGAYESGLAEIQFCMDEDGAASGAYNENYDQPLAEVRYHLIRISGTSILNGCKLLKMFDDIQAVIFCVGLDSYDQMWSDGNNTPLQNRMLLSRDLFETILTHPNFKDKPVVLFLNKFDLFVQKVQTVPLTTCEWFSDFHPVKSNSHTPQSMAEQAYMYVAHMFKKHFETVNPNGGKLHTFQLKGLERPTVSAAFHYVRDILVWEESKKHTFPLTTIYTTETSSVIVSLQTRRRYWPQGSCSTFS